jgi:transcriptional regulator BetI-like protein
VELLRGRRRNTALVREARRLHAIIDGLAIHLLHEPAGAQPDWALDIVRRELARIASSLP